MYYQNNVVATLELMEAMRATGVWRFVFSSTTALTEKLRSFLSKRTRCSSRSILMALPACYRESTRGLRLAYGFGVACLRYFNAAGAIEDGSIGEDHDPETHLIPLVLQVALGQRPNVAVFGRDYPTPDGHAFVITFTSMIWRQLI